MKAAGAALDRQVSADGGDRPARNTRSSGSQQQQQPTKAPTKVIVVQAPKAGAVQAALPTKTILIHPPTSTSSGQRIASNNNNNLSSSSPSMQHVVVHRQSPASPSTITVTLSDSELRQAVASEQSAATALYSAQPGTPLAYVTTQPEFSSVAAATQLVAGAAVHPHHASTQHHMDPYPLSAPTPHHHLQTTPGTYTVYAESYPYYQQYQPSLHSPAQGQTTYIIPGGQQTSPNSLDDESAGHLSHTTRASPATIQWLLQNYETAEGVSLPRCTLYSHYLRHCADNKLDPVNAASFGKLIRSVFLGLRTRRLGTRGNSKYHYYGIRIKPDSPLNRVTEDQMPMAMRNTPQHAGRTKQQTRSTRSAAGGSSGGDFSASGQQATAASTPSPGYPSQPNSLNAAYATASVDSNNSFNDVADDNHRQMLGSGEVPDVLGPDQQGLDAAVQPLGLTLHQVARFVNGYKQNNEDVLECIKNLRFGEIDECWRNFWQPENEQEENEEDKDGESQSGLSQSQLFSLCTIPQIQQYVQNMDFAFYQVLVDVLIPDVLKNIPAPLTQQIRNFAKSLENQLMLAMQGAPDVMQKMKLTAVKTLAQTLRRYTSLNHLAQAARAVLQQPQQISQMLNDLNRVDFVNVQEQASWVCKCDPLLVDQLQTNFKANLAKQKTLEQWAEWLEAVVDQVLASYHDKSLHEIANVAKQFLLKWSFYSSMVIRDLTLRSAQSFGSFHLIRLLYDEYMFYLVEQRLAKAANLSCIAVMAQHPDLFPNASVTVNLLSSEPIFINGAADVLIGNMDDYDEQQRTLPIGDQDDQQGDDGRDEQTILTDSKPTPPQRLTEDIPNLGAIKRARLE